MAFAPPEDLRGSFTNTTREGFRIALDVSVYSLIAVTRAAAPLMTEGGSIMTLSFYAAEKVVPNYNVMAIAKAALECTVRYLAWDLGAKNIRVNAISAGPIKTLAARGVGAMGEMMKAHCRPRAAAPQRGPIGSGWSSAVPRQRSFQRRNRRDAVCGLRLQHHGILAVRPRGSHRKGEVILSERGPKCTSWGSRKQVFVCGAEFGGGESKDLRLGRSIHAPVFRDTRLAARNLDCCENWRCLYSGQTGK